MKTLAFTFLALAFGFISLAQTNRFDNPGSSATPLNHNPMPPSSPSGDDFINRLRFGGNLGAGFGSTFSFVNVSPRVFYLATDDLWLGAGTTFIWTQYKNNPPPFDDQFVWGLNLSAHYFIFEPLFLQAEYEPLSFDNYIFDNGSITGTQRFWTHALMVGGGVSQPVGRGRTFFSIMYNVLWQDQYNSYYISPWVIRIGAGF